MKNKLNCPQKYSIIIINIQNKNMWSTNLVIHKSFKWFSAELHKLQKNICDNLRICFELLIKN